MTTEVESEARVEWSARSADARSASARARSASAAECDAPLYDGEVWVMGLRRRPLVHEVLAGR